MARKWIGFHTGMRKDTSPSTCGSQMGRTSRSLCSPTIVTNVVDFSDVKTGDTVIIREYYRRRDED